MNILVKRYLAACALASFGLLHAATVTADPVVKVHTTPAGLIFRSVQLPADEVEQSIHFAWKDGTPIAQPGKDAVSAVARALMQEGPKGLSKSEMLEELADLQASINLDGTTHYTTGSLLAPPAKLGDAAALFARVLLTPSLPPQKLEQIKADRIKESLQSDENAETLAGRLLVRMILGETQLTNYLIDRPSDYERVTMAEIEVWRRDILARDNLTIVTAGPMTADEVAPEIDRLFSGLPQSARLPTVPKPAMRAPGKLVVLEKPLVQTAIVAGGATGLTVTPDLERAELAIDALHGGMGRLFKVLRDRLGAAYEADAVLLTLDDETRYVSLKASVANESAREALDVFRTEYARYVAEGLTDDEIEPRKTIFISDVQEAAAKAPSLAQTLLKTTVRGYPDDYVATYGQRVRGYSREQINMEIATLFPKAPLTIIIITPSAEGLGADCVIKSPEEIARCG